MLPTKYFVFVMILLIKPYKSDLPEQVVLSVYYESLCPDSKEFIIEQLLPALDLLHNYITLRLIPFGKAFNVEKKHFECQHGPPECLGNMVQGCAIDILYRQVSDVEIAKYVACEMDSEAGSRGDLQCVKSAGLNPNAVAECVISRKGIELQLENEYLTNLVRPKFIPTITFDGVFNQHIQDSSLEDLTETLCSYRQDMEPCAKLYYGG